MTVLPLLRARFLRFGAVGVVGFMVDAGVLHLASRIPGLGLYGGRACSYLAAASTTWALNRIFTFRTQASRNLLGEWARFLAVNLSGGTLNYAVFAVLVAAVPLVRLNPTLGVAAGSVAGLLANYQGSKRLVFREQDGTTEAPVPASSLKQDLSTSSGS